MWTRIENTDDGEMTEEESVQGGDKCTVKSSYV